MIKINKDLKIEFDEEVSHSDIVTFLVGMYSGTISRNIARALCETKDKEWRKELVKTYVKLITIAYEDELRNLFLNMNIPLFNNLGIENEKKEKVKSAIHPLAAFRDK